MPETRVSIGDLRWRFTLYKRVQTANGTAGIDESVGPAAVIWGKIENTYAATFWGIAGQQTERPITHMIWIRWLAYLDNTCALQRQRSLPDGSIKTETFRVRRVAEIDQKTWIVRLECEEESVV